MAPGKRATKPKTAENYLHPVITLVKTSAQEADELLEGNRTVQLKNIRPPTLQVNDDETVWNHLAGTVGAPFNPREHGQIAVKVIDQCGNELLVAKV